MPFDRNNPAHRAQLLAEFQTDPVAVGYAQALAAGASGELARLVLQPDPGGATKTSNEFSTDDLLASLIASPTEYAAVISGHAQAAIRTLFIETLLARGGDRGESARVPVRFHSTLLQLFTNASAPTIRATMIANATGPMSRTEAIFGDDTVITRDDVRAVIA